MPRRMKEASLGMDCPRGKLKCAKTKAQGGGATNAYKTKDKEWMHITVSPNPDIVKHIASETDWLPPVCAPTED